MRRQNPKRRKREWLRAYDSLEFVAYTHQSPSVASGRGPCVCAHVKPDTGLPVGMGRKADACWVVPLTLDEEREKHQHGEESFEKKHRISLPDEARKHWRDYGKG